MENLIFLCSDGNIVREWINLKQWMDINIWDEVFWENSKQFLAVSYFRKKLHLRCLTGLWIPHWEGYSNQSR